MCTFPLLLLAQAVAVPNWWVTPAVALGGPLVGMLFAELLRRRNSSADGHASVTIEHLRGMAQIREEETKERHKLRDQFQDLVSRSEVRISNLERSLEYVKTAYSELYYTAQRHWDAFDAFVLNLRRNNPDVHLPDDGMPRRPDISHLAPIKVFRPHADHPPPD